MIVVCVSRNNEWLLSLGVYPVTCVEKYKGEKLFFSSMLKCLFNENGFSKGVY